MRALQQVLVIFFDHKTEPYWRGIREAVLEMIGGDLIGCILNSIIRTQHETIVELLSEALFAMIKLNKRINFKLELQKLTQEQFKRAYNIALKFTNYKPQFIQYISMISRVEQNMCPIDVLIPQ